MYPWSFVSLNMELNKEKSMLDFTLSDLDLLQFQISKGRKVNHMSKSS